MVVYFAAVTLPSYESVTPVRWFHCA